MPDASTIPAAPAATKAQPPAAAPAKTRMPGPPAGMPTAPWNMIHRSDLNPRKHFDAASLAELAESIAAEGLLQNLVVRPHPKIAGEFELVAGERRHRAVELLIKASRAEPHQKVPVQIRDLDDRTASFLALAENIARSELTPLEEAAAFARLRGMKVSTEDMAAKIGKSRRYVQLRLALVDDLSPKATKALADGLIAVEHARELVKVPSKRQDAIVGRIAPPPGAAVAEMGWGRSIATALQLREELRQNMQPVDQAVFDRALYKGEIHKDPDDGREFFADAALFEKLQQAAIDAKGKELAKSFAFVRFDEHDQLPGMPYDMRKATKEEIAAKKAGVVFGVSKGKFRTLENVVPDTHSGFGRDPGDAKAKEAAKSAPVELPVGAAREALEIRTRALQDAIVADVAHAKRAVVFALLGGSGIVRIRREDWQEQGPAPRVAALLDGFAKRGLKRQKAHQLSEASTAAIWSKIVELTPAHLDLLFNALVAAGVSVENNGARDAGAQDAEVAIAATVKANVSKVFRIDADFLAKLKKPQLLRIVADLKLGGDARLAKGADAVTGSVLRPVILDARDRLQGYVPHWLSFADRKTIHAELQRKVQIDTAKAAAAVAALAKAKPPAKVAGPAKPASKAKPKTIKRGARR